MCGERGLRDVPEELPVGWGGAAGENRAPKPFRLAVGPQLGSLLLGPPLLPFPEAQRVDRSVLGELLGEHRMDSHICVMRELQRLPGRGNQGTGRGAACSPEARLGLDCLCPVPEATRSRLWSEAICD